MANYNSGFTDTSLTLVLQVKVLVNVADEYERYP